MSSRCDFLASLIDYSAMPPGILHSVLTVEASVMKGGHFLSSLTLRSTALVSLMLKENQLASSNASHSDGLVALVVRRVNCLMQPWDWETRLMNSDVPVRRTNADDWPTWPREADSDQTFLAHWLAMLFLLPLITTNEGDHGRDRLTNISHVYKLTAEKAMYFVEFWTKRTGSPKFREIVEQAAVSMMTTSNGQRWHTIPFPRLWRPTDDSDMSQEPIVE